MVTRSTNWRRRSVAGMPNADWCPYLHDLAECSLSKQANFYQTWIRLRGRRSAITNTTRTIQTDVSLYSRHRGAAHAEPHIGNWGSGRRAVRTHFGWCLRTPNVDRRREIVRRGGLLPRLRGGTGADTRRSPPESWGHSRALVLNCDQSAAWASD